MNTNTVLWKKQKKAVETYQCPGCVCGSDITCFEGGSGSLACSRHVGGTMLMPGVGRVFLGMPKGFNRLGAYGEMKIEIFEDAAAGWEYDKFNIPVWKYVDPDTGCLIVRGISPRVNYPFLHVFLGGYEDVKCLEVTKSDMEGMD